jgi:hypothetical protein
VTRPVRRLARLIAAAWRSLTARRSRPAAYIPGPGDRLIRWATAAVVLTVAAFAAVVSYSHIYDLGRAHGQAGTAARLLPLSVDGLILAAGLVLLHAARCGLGAPALARLMLWLGISATIGANVAYGVRFGALGALISAWPAVAFIGSAEMAIGMIRRTRTAAVPEPPADLNGHGHAAAELFAADIEAGRVPGIRAIRSGLQVGQDKAQQVQAYLRTLARTP